MKTKNLGQKVSESRKANKDWYVPNFEYYANACSKDDHSDITKYYDLLKNGIHPDDYKYIMNPYNSPDERYSTMPGKIRNIDIITPLWERYVGEFIAQYDNFIITNSNPEAVELRDAAVTKEVIAVLSRLFMEEMMKRTAELQKQMAENPQAQQQAQQQEAPFSEKEMLDFIKNGKEEWSRKQTVKNKRKLKLLNELTDADEKYIEGFFHWFVAGRVISYHDVRKDDVHKEMIHPLEFKRYASGRYIEDDIAMIRNYKMAIEDIESEFGDDLEPKVLKEIKDAIEAYSNERGVTVPLMLALDKFDIKPLPNSTATDYRLSDVHGIYVTHLVWFSKTKYYELSEELVDVNAMVQFDQLTFSEEEYKIVKEVIPPENFTTQWQEEYWEQYRFGPTHMEIYTKPRPVRVQEADLKGSIGVKAPYNGVYGDIEGLNSSKYARLIEYQKLVNIFMLQLDRTIAKNLDKIMVIPESLMLNSKEFDQESRMYYMKADNKLFINDLDPESVAQAASLLKILDGSLDKYIGSLIDIIEYTKKLAWDQVAMNEERYGNINSGAGKAVTEQTIFRSSLGSRLTFDIYNKFVARDQEKSLNHARIAWPEGKTEAIIEDGKVEFVNVGGGEGVLDDLGVHVKYSSKEMENIQAAKQGAFSIYQNDKPELATAVLNANSMDEITEIMKEFTKINDEYKLREATAVQEANANLVDKKIEEINVDKKWDYDIQQLKEDNANFRANQSTSTTLLASMQTQDKDDSAKEDLENRKLDLLEKANANLASYQNKQIAIKEKELVIKRKAANKVKP